MAQVQDFSEVEQDLLAYLAQPKKRKVRPEKHVPAEAQDKADAAVPETEAKGKADTSIPAIPAFEIGMRVMAAPKTNQWYHERGHFYPRIQGEIDYIHPKKRYYRVSFAQQGSRMHRECFFERELRRPPTADKEHKI